MDTNDLLDADATTIAAAIANRDVSATEMVLATLDRVEARNPALNAVVSHRAEAALDEAAAAVPGSGPLTGVPFVIKDLYAEVTGMPATSGSRLFADRVATVDTEIVARYRRLPASSWWA
ncbi:MAG: amidase family protein [Microthrixaceae bacterium]